MELGFNRGDGQIEHGRVKRRAIDENGKPRGVASSTNNPLTDTREYEVEFIDGRIEVLIANVIAENLLAQIDEEGRRFLLIDQIEDFQRDESALTGNDASYKTSSGMKRRKRTTRGWKFYVRWKDGSADWTTMKDLKDSYPSTISRLRNQQ